MSNNHKRRPPSGANDQIERNNDKIGNTVACPECKSPLSEIPCRKCGAVIPLTAALAQPYIQAVTEQARTEAAELQGSIRKREQELAIRLASLDELETQLASRARHLDSTVEERLQQERKNIVQATVTKLSQAYDAKFRVIEQELREEREKVAKAEEAELLVRKEQRALADEKRRMELEIERRLEAERLKIRESTLQEEEEVFRLKIAEREKIIEDLRAQIERLRQRSDVGCVQLRGETQEVELESVLRSTFVRDKIDAVPNGHVGGDLIQTVIGNGGGVCGSILYESKRAKDFSQQWLAKLRNDQRTLGANIAVLVVSTLPKGIVDFDLLQGVWVTSLRCSRPLAIALRQVLLESSLARLASEQRDGESARVHEYITGTRFKQRVSGLVEALIAMERDDEAEKRSFQRQFAKRQTRRELMVSQLAGLVGDLQSLTKSLPEIADLSLPLLTGNGDGESDENSTAA